ncbi:hypothetical protein PN480_15715 [Dolichospermum circinale CS-1225]|uniref:Uncharacterized protein n=1 Tax=Dolichospermum circinale CS-537/01 TaxID=3021739 RepID=A0ABT5A174_9CYAN|nr:hypothetical protein [Dolichospermum circinale]MDB9458983.1 hypothetical protein [Dolichospermum circinale CS-545/17]MDB9485695.1 hypothetical protein [Dolichospermum circinale CS-537/01]MDB9523381.1 hypothetical protein [Dolichospermum circinale CS-1225]
MGLLLGQYFLEQGIEFFPSGSFSQIIPGIVEYQTELTDRETIFAILNQEQ